MASQSQGSEVSQASQESSSSEEVQYIIEEEEEEEDVVMTDPKGFDEPYDTTDPKNSCTCGEKIEPKSLDWIHCTLCGQWMHAKCCGIINQATVELYAADCQPWYCPECEAQLVRLAFFSLCYQ